MTNDEIKIERALRVQRFSAGFAHGADPTSGRRRVDGVLSSDPSWRAGMEAGRAAIEASLFDWDEGVLRPALAQIRYPDRYANLAPHLSVVDKFGKIVRHGFEEPHDVPGQDICWWCHLDRGDKVHR